MVLTKRFLLMIMLKLSSFTPSLSVILLYESLSWLKEAVSESKLHSKLLQSLIKALINIQLFDGLLAFISLDYKMASLLRRIASILRLNGEAKRYRPRVRISCQTSLCLFSGSNWKRTRGEHFSSPLHCRLNIVTFCSLGWFLKVRYRYGRQFVFLVGLVVDT